MDTVAIMVVLSKLKLHLEFLHKAHSISGRQNLTNYKAKKQVVNIREKVRFQQQNEVDKQK